MVWNCSLIEQHGRGEAWYFEFATDHVAVVIVQEKDGFTQHYQVIDSKTRMSGGDRCSWRYHRLLGPALYGGSLKPSWCVEGKNINCSSQEEFERIMKLRAFETEQDVISAIEEMLEFRKSSKTDFIVDVWSFYCHYRCGQKKWTLVSSKLLDVLCSESWSKLLVENGLIWGTGEITGTRTGILVKMINEQKVLERFLKLQAFQ